MPIRIEYGAQVSPGLPAMAQTAMRIRAEEAARAAARGRGGGGGRSGGGSRGGGSSAAELEQRRAYNASSQSRQDSDEAMQQAGYEQQLKEQGFKYEYTLGQRQEIAQWDNTLQRIDSSDDLNDEEKLIARRQALKKKSGIEKTVLPADPDAMKFPENQAQSLQETWKDEDGNIMAYSAKGEPIVRQDYKDTKPGIQAQWEYEQKQVVDKFMMEIATEEVRDPITKKLGLRNETQIKQIRANLVAAMSEPDEAAKALQQQELIDSSARIFGMGDQQQQDPAVEEQAGFIGLAEQLGVQPNEKEQRLPGDIGAMFAILRTVDERYTDEDGKIDFSKAPPELIQNLEIMEQRAASWLASEQLDRNRKPIPKKKGLKRGKVGGFMGGTMVGQF